MINSQNEIVFLTNLLTQIHEYIPSEHDVKICSCNLVEYIFQKIDRKKFRRKKLGNESKLAIRNKITLSVKQQIPIHFTVPFGGYKHFWNPSHPGPDWAELFNFRYLTEYVLPILQAYKPGVIIEYISEDLILPRMNNYPPESIEKYIETFKKILHWYQQYVPSNLEFRFFRVSDKCNKNTLISEVESLLPERTAAFAKLSDEKNENELKRSVRSVYWNGDKDLTQLSEDQKLKRIIESRIIELAYYDTEAKPEYLGNYLGEDNHICICFSFGLSSDNAFDDLTLGSSYASIVDYWIGRGVLEVSNTTYIPRIISHKQYDATKNTFTVINVDLPIPGENYSTIEIAPIHSYG